MQTKHNTIKRIKLPEKLHMPWSIHLGIIHYDRNELIIPKTKTLFVFHSGIKSYGTHGFSHNSFIFVENKVNVHLLNMISDRAKILHIHTYTNGQTFI